MPDIPDHVLLAVQASFHLLLKNPKKCPFTSTMSKFLYKIILRPDILGIFYQIFFRETPFLKLDLLYNHVINITP